MIRTRALTLTRLLTTLVVLGAGAPACSAQASPGEVVGSGTPASCTSRALVAAVAQGGTITFACGPRPVTIAMTQTAKVVNTSASVVIDGGGRVTLSGGNARRVLYMNTCDRAQTWTTSHCEQQATPHLTIERLTIEAGLSAGDGETGGGGVYAFGGQLTVAHDTFLDDRCAPASGPAVGGGALAALWQDRAHPVEVTASVFRGDACANGGAGGGGGAIFATQNDLAVSGSTFDDDSCAPTGPDVGGGAVRAYLEHAPVLVAGSDFTDDVCSNGGALSSIGASWTVRNSRFTGDQAIGTGANPPRPGTPGGGSGGAIYNDGDTMHLALVGCTLRGDSAREGGGAIFFVSDDRTGTMSIASSTLVDDPNAGFHTPGLPGIFFLGAHPPTITGSVIGP